MDSLQILEISFNEANKKVRLYLDFDLVFAYAVHIQLQKTVSQQDLVANKCYWYYYFTILDNRPVIKN